MYEPKKSIFVDPVADYINSLEERIEKLEDLIKVVDHKQATNSLQVISRIESLESKLNKHMNDVDLAHRI